MLNISWPDEVQSTPLSSVSIFCQKLLNSPLDLPYFQWSYTLDSWVRTLTEFPLDFIAPICADPQPIEINVYVDVETSTNMNS